MPVAMVERQYIRSNISSTDNEVTPNVISSVVIENARKLEQVDHGTTSAAFYRVSLSWAIFIFRVLQVKSLPMFFYCNIFNNSAFYLAP